MPPTHAHLCGLWDGMHLWVQWDDTVPDAGYRLQVRLRPNDQAAWEPWRDVSAKSLRRAWAVVPLWREGWSVQARVAAGNPETSWTLATEVTFQRARCAFEISTAAGRVHYLPRVGRARGRARGSFPARPWPRQSPRAARAAAPAPAQTGCSS